MADSGHWLARRLAVVTGASHGIGRATAMACAAAGARVILAARDGEALEDLGRRIGQAGGEATAVPTDVSRSSDVERLFETAEQTGPVAALVCAAGTLTRVPLEETTCQVWEETLGTNLTGCFLCCRAAFVAMRRGGEGRIVNIASLSGIYGTEKFPGLSAYNVSKYGVVGLTEAVAVEGREHGITAICVSPGAVDTDMLHRAHPGLRAGLSPEDVASFIVGLLDNPMTPASGANIPLFSNA